MELPLLVDFLYINRGRAPNKLAAGTRRMCPRSLTVASSAANHLLPWQTICESRASIVSQRCQDTTVL